jgi:hypothetical protein
LADNDSSLPDLEPVLEDSTLKLAGRFDRQPSVKYGNFDPQYWATLDLEKSRRKSKSPKPKKKKKKLPPWEPEPPLSSEVSAAWCESSAVWCALLMNKNK